MDKGTGKEQKITIQASGGLTDEDIDKMVRDAEENAEADKQRRESVEAKNNAEALIHATDKSLAEHGEKVDAETKTTIETARDDLKSALEGDDVEAIKAKHQALMEASMKLGEAIYKAEAEAAQAAEAETAEDGARSQDDDVVDADFEEVKDDDKKAS
jgi:molecular chaperone DnaK